MQCRQPAKRDRARGSCLTFVIAKVWDQVLNLEITVHVPSPKFSGKPIKQKTPKDCSLIPVPYVLESPSSMTDLKSDKNSLLDENRLTRQALRVKAKEATRYGG